jgi:hypothetical protein
MTNAAAEGTAVGRPGGAGQASIDRGGRRGIPLSGRPRAAPRRTRSPRGAGADVAHPAETRIIPTWPHNGHHAQQAGGRRARRAAAARHRAEHRGGDAPFGVDFRSPLATAQYLTVCARCCWVGGLLESSCGRARDRPGPPMMASALRARLRLCGAEADSLGLPRSYIQRTALPAPTRRRRGGRGVDPARPVCVAGIGAAPGGVRPAPVLQPDVQRRRHPEAADGLSQLVGDLVVYGGEARWRATTGRAAGFGEGARSSPVRTGRLHDRTPRRRAANG